MDPRVRLASYSSESLQSLQFSYSEHIEWLHAHLDQVRRDAEARKANGQQAPAAAATTSVASLLKSPTRKRTAPVRQPAANTTILTQKASNTTSSIFRSPSASSAAVRPPLAPLGASAKQQSTTSSTSSASVKSLLQRSPAKKKLNDDLDIENEHSRQNLRPAAKAQHHVLPTQAAAPQPLTKSIRPAQIRSPLTASASARLRHASPSTTPRPPSRIAKSPQARKQEPPTKPQIGDVFSDATTPGAKQLVLSGSPMKDTQNNEEEQEAEEEDEEIADILLGYAKTPLGRTPRSVEPSSTLASDKLLPVLPITTLTALHTSPVPAASLARPKSPPRPASPTNLPVPVSRAHASPPRAANVSPNKPVGHVKRDMSHLGSIASVLGSPSKPAQPLQTKAHDTHRAAIEAFKAIASPIRKEKESRIPGRPASPVPSTSVPAAQPSKIASPTARPRSPRSPPKLVSAILGKVHKAASPPTRASPRLAARSPPGSPSLSRPPTVPASPRLRSPKIAQKPCESVQDDIQQPLSASLSNISQYNEMSKEAVTAPTSPLISPVEFNRPVSPARPTSPAALRQASQIPQSPVRRPALSPLQSPKTLASKVPSAGDRPPKSPLRPKAVEPVAAETAPAQEKAQVEAPKHRSVREEIEAGLVAKKAAEVAESSKTIVKDVNAVEATTASEVQSAKDPELAAPLPAQTPAPASTQTANGLPKASYTAPSTLHPPTQTGTLGHPHSASGAGIPPSPVFSSFLSNTNRSSVLPFGGLGGRLLGQVGREKSLGVGLGLGKSLGAGLMRERERENASEQSESQPSRKRPSWALDSQESQTSKAPKLDPKPVTTQALSKEEETKQRLDMLRSRISSIKGSRASSATSSAVLSHTRMSVTASTTAIASANTRVSVTAAPPALPKEADPLPAQPAALALAKSSPPKPINASPSLAASATSAFASAVASLVPAPAFHGFASLFGSSTTSAAPVAADPVGILDQHERSSSPIRALYPSLEPLVKTGSRDNFFARPAEKENEDEMEILIPGVAPDVPLVAPAMQRSTSATSVKSLVSTFEAKREAVEKELERERSLSPVKRRENSAPSQAPPLPSKAVSVPARSTTPPFSPPAVAPAPATTSHAIAKSASGELDIDDPEVEPIPRAQSVETEMPDPSEADIEDEDMPEEVVSDADDEEDNEVLRLIQPSAAPKQAAPASDLLDYGDAEDVPLGKSLKVPAKPVVPVRANTSTLSKSTGFKPTRPGTDAQGSAKPTQGTLSRAPSIASLAPSRASTISVASSSQSAVTKTAGTTTLTTVKKIGLSSSTAGRPELKSLQLAAAAAKKEQAEKDRKAVQKEERDQKRAALTAGAEDKKRKERDDTSVLKGKAPEARANEAAASKSVTEEAPKKRKMDTVEVVIPSKPLMKKTTVVRKAPSAAFQNKSVAGPSMSFASSTKQASSTSQKKVSTVNGTSSTVVKQTNTSIHLNKSVLTASTKAPPQAKAGPSKSLVAQHQQAIMQASQALAKSQAASSKQPLRPVQPVEPEPEPFQLPEIDSEYSDSDEETQAAKAAARPVWTHSPELRQALAVQAQFNPDELFGAIPQLQMEDIFKNKATSARLRMRTSSAHWSGPDALSAYEEQEYARRMGFKSGNP